VLLEEIGLPDVPQEVSRRWLPEGASIRYHATEGRRRTRLGLAPHTMPGATNQDLQVLAGIVRRVRAGSLDWTDVDTYPQRRILPGRSS
jgi:hypothetical protein